MTVTEQIEYVYGTSIHYIKVKQLFGYEFTDQFEQPNGRPYLGRPELNVLFNNPSNNWGDGKRLILRLKQ